MVPSLEGLAPFQIAFIVRDLDRAVHEFDARLSAGPWCGWVSVRKVGGASTTEYPRSGPCASVLNNQRPQYELIEPLTGPSIPADWLAERGEGFHHVGYVVASLAHVTAEMEAAGHPAVARIHSFGANGDGAAAYFDTADALGFMVEAVEPPAPMPTTDFTY